MAPAQRIKNYVHKEYIFHTNITSNIIACVLTGIQKIRDSVNPEKYEYGIKTYSDGVLDVDNDKIINEHILNYDVYLINSKNIFEVSKISIDNTSNIFSCKLITEKITGEYLFKISLGVFEIYFENVLLYKITGGYIDVLYDNFHVYMVEKSLNNKIRKSQDDNTQINVCSE